jgi:serine/threonine-protein kinase CHEK2
MTQAESTNNTGFMEGTITPPSQIRHRTPQSSPPPLLPALSPPVSETQAFSQFVFPAQSLSNEVLDEEEEGVWGYLIPLERHWGDTLVLRQRDACPAPAAVNSEFGKGGRRRTLGPPEGDGFGREEEKYEENKAQKGLPAGGYLLGRHPECGKMGRALGLVTVSDQKYVDRVLDLPTISNRHCLIFCERKGGETVAVLEDLSSNGTFVNEAIVGRNKRRELQDADEISMLDGARFIFRYPRSRDDSGFRHQYRILQQLGKGHFATVFLCVEKATGFRYAVKRFEKRPGGDDRSRTEGLQQEIAVLMGVSHPNLICLKSTFDEKEAVYLVLELAPEGELFNWIVMKQKLTEEETRRVFIQLFQAVKYLVGFPYRQARPTGLL